VALCNFIVKFPGLEDADCRRDYQQLCGDGLQSGEGQKGSQQDRLEWNRTGLCLAVEIIADSLSFRTLEIVFKF